MIRHATSDDFEIIYDFINQLEGQIFDKKQQFEIYTKNQTSDNCIHILAFEEDRAVGYISCYIQWLLHHSAQMAEIQEMFVVEEFRSKGVGNQLMQFLLDELKRKNITHVEVTSSKRREAAHRLYLKEGFADSHKKFTREV